MRPPYAYTKALQLSKEKKKNIPLYFNRVQCQPQLNRYKHLLRSKSFNFLVRYCKKITAVYVSDLINVGEETAFELCALIKITFHEVA